MQKRRLVACCILVIASLSCQSRNPPSKTTSTLEERAETPVPQGLKAVATNDAIKLSWQEVSAASSYRVYWSKKKGVSKNDASLDRIRTAGTTHRFLANGTAYYYRVAAIGTGGISELSNEVTAIAGSGSAQSTVDVTAHFGRVSDNGSVIAFAGEDCNGSPCVYIKRDAEPAKLLNLYPIDVGAGTRTFLNISGDGNTVAYTSNSGLFIHRFVSKTWNQILISANPADAFPSLNTDGTRVAWIDAGKVKVSSRSGSQWTSKTVSNGTQVSIDQSGNKLAYENGGKVFYANEAGGIWNSSEIGAGTWPAISGNGSRIIYRRASDQKLVIHTVGDTTESTEIADCCMAPPFINLGGDLVGYNQNFAKWKSGAWQDSDNFAALAEFVDITPDGKYVLFTSNANIYLQAIDGSTEPVQVDIVSY